jgi:hypothetical protein
MFGCEYDRFPTLVDKKFAASEQQRADRCINAFNLIVDLRSRDQVAGRALLKDMHDVASNVARSS